MGRPRKVSSAAYCHHHSFSSVAFYFSAAVFSLCAVCDPRVDEAIWWAELWAGSQEGAGSECQLCR